MAITNHGLGRYGALWLYSKMRAGYAEWHQKRHAMRHQAVRSILLAADVRSVLDLGCGDGQLLEMLARDKQFTRLTGVDENAESLQVAGTFTGPIVTERGGDLAVSYHVGSLLEKPLKLPRHDAVTLVEVIEHFSLGELSHVEDVIFRKLRPRIVVVTTPSAIPEVGKSVSTRLPHKPDHAFEWTPEEAAQWMNQVAKEYSYKPRQQVLSSKPLPGLDLQIISFER